MVHLIQWRAVGYVKSPKHRTSLLFYFLCLKWGKHRVTLAGISASHKLNFLFNIDSSEQPSSQRTLYTMWCKYTPQTCEKEKKMTFTSNSVLSSESEEVKLKKQGWDGLDMCSAGIVDKMDKNGPQKRFLDVMKERCCDRGGCWG